MIWIRVGNVVGWVWDLVGGNCGCVGGGGGRWRSPREKIPNIVLRLFVRTEIYIVDFKGF